MSEIRPSVRPSSTFPVMAAYLIAIAAPTLLAYNLTPSPTLLNQLVAVAGWGLCLMMHDAGPADGAGVRAIATLAAALGLVTAGALASWTLGDLPTSLALPSVLSLLAAIAVAALGARSARRAGSQGLQAFSPFAIAMVTAGVGSALIAIVQVFFPDLPDHLVQSVWPDGSGADLIARSGLPGRAVGNLRQPNHLASLLIWAVIALVPLLEWGRLKARTVAALGVLFLVGVLLSGSRTGLYGGVLILVLWGLADRRLSRTARVMLVSLVVVTPLLWFGLSELLALTHHVFGAKARLGEGDSSHFAIWRNALAMIGQQPWLGVGWGNFNLAWTLTPFPDRPVAFFDHTHNLVLQLAVELGVPLAAAVIALLAWALWQGLRRAGSEPGPVGAGARAAWVMVAVIALHSMDEYPLWYTYFLLPAAWAWGFALGAGRAGEAADGRPLRGLHAERLAAGAGIAMLAVAVAGWINYHAVSTIFDDDDGLPPLTQRIARGEQSLLFAHHADYADATTTEPVSRALPALERASHALIDTRLMVAWSQALTQIGQSGRASYVAARLREFRKSDREAVDFFAPCNDPAVVDKPAQCLPPPPGLSWRDFR